jgi:hypothetical protein
MPLLHLQDETIFLATYRAIFLPCIFHTLYNLSLPTFWIIFFATSWTKVLSNILENLPCHILDNLPFSPWAIFLATSWTIFLPHLAIFFHHLGQSSFLTLDNLPSSPCVIFLPRLVQSSFLTLCNLPCHFLEYLPSLVIYLNPVYWRIDKKSQPAKESIRSLNELINRD